MLHFDNLIVFSNVLFVSKILNNTAPLPLGVLSRQPGPPGPQAAMTAVYLNVAQPLQMAFSFRQTPTALNFPLTKRISLAKSESSIRKKAMVALILLIVIVAFSYVLL